MAAVETVNNISWWKEPTKDQWYAWWAAWLGWTLDAFDFTVFLLIIKPIADEFHVPTTEVAIVFTLTLWMRLVGAVASGWLADRVGRKTPLMISIFWYSICNFIAGFSPTLLFLLVFRTLLGIGMGAEWPAGAALAMEQWPIRSRDRSHPLLCQRAADLGREPPPSAGREARGSRPADQDFPTGNAGQHPVGVLVDGEQFYPLLLDLGIVRDAPASGSEAD